MKILGTVLIVIVVLLLLGFALSARIVKQYQDGVLFRLGRVIGERKPGFRLIIPFVDVLHRVSLRIVTMPIQSQGIITRDNVSVDVSAVAYFKVVDAVKSVVAIENVYSAIDQIAQTTLRKVVGQHTLDQTLSETDKINLDIRKILDVTTVDWGIEVTLVELKDIQLPDSMKRAMARQAEAEREKRAKIINAEGESLAAAALGEASDMMMAHPLALQLRNLQSLVEIGVDKNTTVVFPAPLMTTIAELGSFLAREQAAAGSPMQPILVPTPATNGRRSSMTNPLRFPRTTLNLEYPMSLDVYDDYAQAQRVVDDLASHEFPVQNVVIVGTELKSVERVTGRLTHGKVAAAGTISGLWIGLFVGIAFALFSRQNQFGFLITTPILGAVFGLVWSQIGFRAATRNGTRDFASVSQVVATKYEVLIEHRFIEQARQLVAAMPRS